MKRLALLFSLASVLLAALVTTACGAIIQPVTPAPAETPTVITQPTATPAPPTPTPEPPTATPANAQVVLNLSELAAANTLDSYRSHTLLAYEGVDTTGQPDKATLDLSVEYAREPRSRRLVLSESGISDKSQGATQPNLINYYQIGNKLYSNFGSQWMMITGDETLPFDTPDTAFLADSNLLFADQLHLTPAGPDEEVNGIASRRYTFDIGSLADWLDLSQGQAVKADGQVWIAAEGNYITRLQIDMVLASSGSTLAPDLSQGNLRIEYELSDPNADIAVELPEEALAGITLRGFEDDDFPLPEGADVQMANALFKAAATSLSAEEAQAFYEEALPTLGWSKAEVATPLANSLADLSFVKAPYRLNLSIRVDPATGATQVLAGIKVEEQP